MQTGYYAAVVHQWKDGLNDMIKDNDIIIPRKIATEVNRSNFSWEPIVLEI